MWIVGIALGEHEQRAASCDAFLHLEKLPLPAFALSLRCTSVEFRSSYSSLHHGTQGGKPAQSLGPVVGDQPLVSVPDHKEKPSTRILQTGRT